MIMEDKEYLTLYERESHGLKVIVREEKLDPEMRKERILDIRRDIENHMRTTARLSSFGENTLNKPLLKK